jgi:hypothetical protein
MKPLQRSYSMQDIVHEYLVFLVGAVLIGAMVAWAEWPHGMARAISFGAGMTVFAAAFSTVGLFRRRSTYRRYIRTQRFNQ